MRAGQGRPVLIALMMAALLGACALVPSPSARLAHAEALANAKGWRSLTLSAAPFVVQAFVPPVPPAASGIDTLTVYVEGDGLAWVTRARPSDDPTPREPLALQLALAQPQGVAAYLARPCQFVLPRHLGQGCDARYWAQARFSPEVIEGESTAIDQLMRHFSAQRLVLVGYSGGGAVAALLAARRPDVVALVTVAGNLDPAAWTQHHGVAPLTGSLNPADERAALASIPQVHLVGADDRVMPPAIAQAFVSGFPSARRPVVITLAGRDHACCWATAWPALWRDVTDALARQ